MLPVSPCRSRRRTRTLLVAAAASVAGAAPVSAQLPGLPMLQSPFTSAGRAVAANYGSGDAFAAIALAGAWTPASNRFQVSGGLGVASPETSDGRATGVGARLAVPVHTRWTGPDATLGLAAFAGIGGAWESGGGELRVPAGASVAYRRPLGATRAIAAYVTPYFQWSRRTGDGFGGGSGGAAGDGAAVMRDDSDLVRAAVGIDALLTTRLGLTVGYDFGQSAEPGRPGPTSGIFGAGLSVRF